MGTCYHEGQRHNGRASHKPSHSNNINRMKTRWGKENTARNTVQREINDRIGHKSNAQIHHLFHLKRSNINTEDITFLATTNFVWFFFLSGRFSFFSFVRMCSFCAQLLLSLSLPIALYSMDYWDDVHNEQVQVSTSISYPLRTIIAIMDDDGDDNVDDKRIWKRSIIGESLGPGAWSVCRSRNVCSVSSLSQLCHKNDYYIYIRIFPVTYFECVRFETD